MGSNILITGAAGFVGGSVLAEFLSRTSGPLTVANISAAVRSAEQAEALAKLGVNVIQVELSNEAAVMEVVLRNEINIIVHLASSYDSIIELHLINALGERRKVSGEETYFIHSSVTTMFSAEGGWPYGEARDDDALFEKEKQIQRGNPVRDTNIFVIEQAKAQHVTSFIVPLPFVYGRGSGEWKKVSVFIPAIIRASIKHKIVYKFDVDANPPAGHISDVVAVYTLLVEKILQKESIPSGEQGYYFAFSHKANWWKVMQRLSEALYARRLVSKAEAKIWPSDEMAAEYLGFPPMFVRVMGTSSGELVRVNAHQLGWQPKWDADMFLESMDDEIQAVQDLDKVAVTVFDKIIASSK